MNLAQIRSAAPDVFHKQTKTQTYSAKNRTFRSSLHAVIQSHLILKLIDDFSLSGFFNA